MVVVSAMEKIREKGMQGVGRLATYIVSSKAPLI